MAEFLRVSVKPTLGLLPLTDFGNANSPADVPRAIEDAILSWQQLYQCDFGGIG
jgi:hypothetical protein